MRSKFGGVFVINHQQQKLTGVKNLLLNCSGCQPGHSLLVVFEPQSVGYYSNELKAHICLAAEEMGLHVSEYEVAF